MTAAQVRIHDVVVLPCAEVTAWTGEFRREYVPGAVRRGLTLDSVAHEHVGTDTTAVHILWTLPTVGAFFGMRHQAGTDPSVAAFWAATDARAVRRERHVQSLEQLDEEATP